MRGLDATRLTPIQRAVRFLYLNRFCFNGLYRTNSSGNFNVPFAKSKTGDFPSVDDFIAASELLRNAELINVDFESVVWDNAKTNDFIYLDPPLRSKQSAPFFRLRAPALLCSMTSGVSRKLLRKLIVAGRSLSFPMPNVRKRSHCCKVAPSANQHSAKTSLVLQAPRKKANEVIYTNITDGSEGS